MFSHWLLALALSVGAQESEKTPEPALPDTIAGEELSDLLEKWPNEYVRWIITDAEKTVYESLLTDEEKLKFIEFFWARRDSNPETVDNEYRTQYLERYAFVANYLSAGKPGWATDRGRIYLILGPPHARESNPFGRYGAERPSEVWTYNNLDIPNFPASIDFQFVDFDGTGDFELVQDIDSTAPIWNQFGTVNNALDAIAQRRLVIGEVDPRTGRDRFTNVDNSILVAQEFDLQQNLRQVFNTPARELPELDTVVDTRASFGNLTVTAVGGAVRGDDGTARVPVNVTVPYRQVGSREQDGQIVYELDYAVVASKQDGEEVSRVSDQLTLTFDAGVRDNLMEQRLSIQETLKVPPGDYQVLAYVRDRRRNRLGSTEFPLHVVAPEPQGLSLSSVFLAREMVTGVVGESKPFQFGTVRVIPATEAVFTRDDSLKLYVEAYGAVTGDEGRKRLRVDFFVMQHGRLYMGVPAANLRPETDPVGITSEIPLRKCGPGSYVMRVRVTDETTGAKAESETSFVVVSGEAP